MKIVDAYILARTKRKTRRIRTALVVIISSLLFAVLFAVAFMAQGIRDTASQVKDVGYNGRNMVMISPTGRTSFDFIGEQKKIEADMAAELRARGIKVTEQTKLDPSYQGELARRDMKIVAEYNEKESKRFEDSIYRLGRPDGLYHFSAMDLALFARYQTDPKVDPMVEELKSQEATGGSGSQKGGYNPYEGFQFFSAERGMIDSQLQPGYDFSWQPGEAFPMVVSYAYLEQLSERSFAKVGAAEKNQAYRELMKTYSGKELEYCHRNATAQDQLRQVIHYNYAAANDKDASTKPIDVPVCGDFDQKLLKKLKLIDVEDDSGTKPLFKAPALPAPLTQKIKFKIVGFIPSTSNFSGNDPISQIFTGINTLPAPSQLGIVPSEIVAQNAVLQQGEGYSFGYASLFADFKTRAEQKAFIDQGCGGNDCSKGEKPYIAAYGSVSQALEGTFKTLNKFLFIGMGVVMVIAALMIMFTISKVISDSTKEIAVFRSLGARRRDIAQIYYTYGMMLATASVALAIIIAIIGAHVATSMYDDRIANSLIQAVGAYNTNVHATLFAVNWQWLGLIAAAMIVAALIGITIPILASLRRKLINILREE